MHVPTYLLALHNFRPLFNSPPLKMAINMQRHYMSKIVIWEDNKNFVLTSEGIFSFTDLIKNRIYTPSKRFKVNPKKITFNELFILFTHTSEGSKIEKMKSMLLYVRLKNDVFLISFPSPLYRGNTLSLTNVVTYPHCFLVAYKRLWMFACLGWNVGFKKTQIYRQSPVKKTSQ